MKTRLACATVVLLALPRLASACPVCFGAADGAMAQGSSMGILVLLIVTLVMLGAFGAFFAVLARRAKAADVSADDGARVDWQASVAGGHSR